MIKEHCFTKEWVEAFKKEKEYRRINPPVLEKMIHALCFLQYIQEGGLKFTFKGGTSLVLLLQEARRFSVDIDIISLRSREEIEKVIDKAVKDSHFERWTLDERRSYKEGVPKAHYFIYYTSRLSQRANYILLDILFEENVYPETINVPVNSKWIDPVKEVPVSVPTVESILGEKLTAFAPRTTGIPFGKGLEQEIVKQLFDISELFDYAKDLKAVAGSFEKVGQKEIGYRQIDIETPAILDDIIRTATVIAKRDKNKDPQDKKDMAELVQGIKSFRNFLVSGMFQIEDTIKAAGKAAYLAVVLKQEAYGHMERYDENKPVPDTIDDPEWSFLNKLKKLKDRSTFFYWAKTVDRLKKQ